MENMVGMNGNLSTAGSLSAKIKRTTYWVKLCCYYVTIPIFFPQFLLSKSRIWYRLRVDNSVRCLSAKIYSIFIVTDLQNPIAAMAYSTAPLTLFTSPHEEKSIRKQEKMQIFLAWVVLSHSSVKVFICGSTRKKNPRNTTRWMLTMCWHSWLERWVKHLPYFSICSRLPTLQCSAATTHNCELIWILSECHPAISVDCIVLPATFQFLSKPLENICFCRHAHARTHTHITRV